jgi:hypothetical protein
MYGLHHEFAFLVGTKKANFKAQVRFLFGLIFTEKSELFAFSLAVFWDSIRE